jgi:hypothetical protein
MPANILSSVYAELLAGASSDGLEPNVAERLVTKADAHSW